VTPEQDHDLTDDEWLRRRSLADAFPCKCWSCTASRATDAMKAALEDIDAAHNAWLNEATDSEGSLYFLRDEIAAIAASRWARPVRKRLLTALRAAFPEVSEA
jgi:hypothetical protein